MARREVAEPAARTALSLASWRRSARARLAGAGIENAAQEADHLARHVLGLSAVDLVVGGARPLTVAETRRLGRLLARRARRVPLPYVLGDVDFRGLRLGVNRSVLVPRPETEGLVERVVMFLRPLEQGVVADIGTGSGAIALAVAAERPGVRVLATDISPAALRVARANARRLGLAERVRFCLGDLTGPLERSAAREPFRVLVSNPPYVSFRERRDLAPEVLAEPATALFAKRGGMDVIRRLVPRAARLLGAGGLLALEIGEHQGDRTLHLLAGPSWREARVERDLAGKIRYALARRAP